METKIKLAVIGSRKYTDRDRLYKILDKNINRIEMIVSGGCPNSPDEIAHDWARERGIPILIFYPKWKRDDGSVDKSAGFCRNKYIIEAADKVLAVWNGKSKGTEDSILIAKRLNKEVKIVNF